MALTVAAIVAVCMLGMRPVSIRSIGHGAGWRSLLAGRPLASVGFLDGPRAGTRAELTVGADGLPPRQLCALVRRAVEDGGDYTLPYQRALPSEDDRLWLYTQGWTAMSSRTFRTRYRPRRVEV